MATWKVHINGKQRSALDPEQLLGAVLALGRQFAEEKRRRHLREARQAQSSGMRNEQSTDARTSAASGLEVR